MPAVGTASRDSATSAAGKYVKVEPYEDDQPDAPDQVGADEPGGVEEEILKSGANRAADGRPWRQIEGLGIDGLGRLAQPLTPAAAMPSTK